VKVVLDGVQPQPDAVAEALARQLDWLGLRPSRSETWAVKLNLTYPRYLPGVVNSPAFVEGLCRWAREHAVRLNFVEGDGGNGAYSAEDTFAGNGISEIASRHGMATTSLSEEPWHWRETRVAGRLVRLPYSPFFQRRPYERFVTAPLFKNHIFTVVSLGMKNLWGCIPDAYRMYYHHLLHHGIVALCKELRPDFSIFDGLVALRGRGPMDGRPLQMNAVMAVDTVGAGEAAALRIMGIPLGQVRHLRLAHAEGLVPEKAQLEWREPPTAFERTDFRVKRSLLNRVSIGLSHFPSLQRVVYHSGLSDSIYGLVDLFRRGSATARLVRDKREGRYRSIPFDR
jgi:uncharacterized protein (DUF362 family)